MLRPDEPRTTISPNGSREQRGTARLRRFIDNPRRAAYPSDLRKACPPPEDGEHTPRRPLRTQRITRGLVAVVAVLVVAGGVAGGGLAYKRLRRAVCCSRHRRRPLTSSTVQHPSTTTHHAPGNYTSRRLSSSATRGVRRALGDVHRRGLRRRALLVRIPAQREPDRAVARDGDARRRRSNELPAVATGSLAITVGAPSKITKVIVNGTLLGLPTRRGQLPT